MAAATRLISRLTLVTGGGSGIGRAVCQRFASEGASVVVADISEESANETLGSLPTDLRGQGHLAAVVDVSSKESVKKLVTSIQVDFSWDESAVRHTDADQGEPVMMIVVIIINY